MRTTLARRTLHSILALAAVVWLGAGLVAASPFSRSDADRFVQKLVRIVQRGNGGAGAASRTVLTEREVNAYLAFHGRDDIPAGIADPYISIVGTGRLRGRALIDLDAVRRQRDDRGWLDPLAYLGGRLPVTASGVLRTQNGVGRFELESAEISGVSVPKGVLQPLVAYYSRTADHPQGYNLDDPFALPASIREIEVGKGQAVVVQ